ncbi:hypothetical protein ILUMI_01425 [Ignelater luminosus]|uniref:Uncharacterized protein n=1 Tax=Ignelater luminosus TaxID=2038154 RepID=A0A8K0GHG5_IGNLU|nr:hypothetical protein ILUMI_01425 [Ignelater luminosus]
MSPTLSKVLEKSVENQIQVHLQECSTLAEKHSGFKLSFATFSKSYLSQEVQEVVLSDNSSSYIEVINGSTLGPILFVIYTSSSAEYLTYCNYHSYADATQIYISFNPQERATTCTELNHDQPALYLTSKRHLITLN